MATPSQELLRAAKQVLIEDHLHQARTHRTLVRGLILFRNRCICRSMRRSIRLGCSFGLVCLAGCALSSALSHPFGPGVEPLPVERSFAGTSGTSMHGLVLELDAAPSRFIAIDNEGVLGHSDETFRLTRDERVVWRVRCASRLVLKAQPASTVACELTPSDEQGETLVLALAATATAPLSGVFFSERGPVLVHGRRDDALSFGTTSFELAKRGARPFAFIGGHAGGYAVPRADPEILRAIGPLLLTLLINPDLRDALTEWRASASRAAESAVEIMERGHPRPIVLPVHAPEDLATPLARASARLVELGQEDAARALLPLFASASSARVFERPGTSDQSARSGNPRRERLALTE